MKDVKKNGARKKTESNEKARQKLTDKNSSFL